jgi:hypothetical protein
MLINYGTDKGAFMFDASALIEVTDDKSIIERDIIDVDFQKELIRKGIPASIFEYLS